MAYGQDLITLPNYNKDEKLWQESVSHHMKSNPHVGVVKQWPKKSHSIIAGRWLSSCATNACDNLSGVYDAPQSKYLVK